LRHVTDPITRYYHVLAALSVDSVRLVRHVLHEDTRPNSYDQLRNYQKMEGMMQLLPLGDRKPSVMLAEMMEFCPAGESSTAISPSCFFSGYRVRCGFC
jgi:hypothetical protein